jgi:hypothetical protein
MPILRSVAAIVAGIALFSLLLLAAMAVGNALLGSEPEWINRSVTTQVVWLIWNIVSMVSAGYVAAVVARRAQATHAIVMGSIQSVFTLVAMLTVGDNVTPQWLWIAGIVATIPAAWAGSRLRGAR